jgi:hypothetical protein
MAEAMAGIDLRLSEFEVTLVFTTGEIRLRLIAGVSAMRY